MRGDDSLLTEASRYLKFSWTDLDQLPEVGKTVSVPNSGALYLRSSGTFHPTHSMAFSPIKAHRTLPPLGYCAFCGRDKDAQGKLLKLTDEHIVPEFLGAGVELRRATCVDCQAITARFESEVARHMFDPVRKHLVLNGKGGVIENTSFPVDIGREISDRVFIPIIHYPTVLVLPMLFPASAYSNRLSNTDGLYRLRMHNINASKRNLEQYEIGTLSTQAIDTVRFCQMIAKIGVAYAATEFDPRTFSPDLMHLITTDMPKGTTYVSHYNRVGCIWESQGEATGDLHQLELGTIDWLGQSILTAKVRLFACYDMPSYFVALN